jgi:hypothetical protein
MGRAYRCKMKAEGDRYAATMSKLEWMYMGQDSLSITSKGSKDGQRRTVLLREESGSVKMTVKCYGECSLGVRVISISYLCGITMDEDVFFLRWDCLRLKSHERGEKLCRNSAF